MLYARQLAWLHAVPKAPGDHKAVGQRLRSVSRIEDLRRKGIVPDLPDVSLPYLRDYFLKVGPAMNGGFGAIAVTEEELGWFQRNRGLSFTPFEVDAIRRMSGEYVAELHAAEAHDRRPPYVRDYRQRRREVVRKIDAVFG